jgi:hypothetical protein
VSPLIYCTSSASSRGWRNRWLLVTSSRGVTSPLCCGVNVAREQLCYLARVRYENCSPGLKLSRSARASFNGIVVLSYRGCKVTSEVGGVADSLTRPTRCTDTIVIQLADLSPRHTCCSPMCHLLLLSQAHTLKMMLYMHPSSLVFHMELRSDRDTLP